MCRVALIVVEKDPQVVIFMEEVLLSVLMVLRWLHLLRKL